MIAIMFKAVLYFLLALPLAHASDEMVKPDQISVHTWVREDMFAGWIGNDTVTMERGVKKLDRYLADHPDDRGALSWKYLAISYRMIQARRGHDDVAYAKQLAAGKELRSRIFTGEVRDPAPYIIVGSSLVEVASVAPEQDRGWMFKDGRDLLAKVPELQGKVFDNLPPHMRGEVGAQIAC